MQHQGNQLQNSETKLAALTNNQILDILIISNISRPNNFNSLTKEEWKWIVTEIKKDFGDKLTHSKLTSIISNGVKGRYDKIQFVVNGFTIYKWIEKQLEIDKLAPKKEIPRPSNIESFYWTQMSERDQLAWVEKGNKNKKIEQ